MGRGSSWHHPHPHPALGFAGWEPPTDVCQGDFNPWNLRSPRAAVRIPRVDTQEEAGSVPGEGCCQAVYYYLDSTSLPSWIQSNSCPQGGADQRRSHGHMRPKAKFPDSGLPRKCSLTLRNLPTQPHLSSASFDNRKSPKEISQPQLHHRTTHLFPPHPVPAAFPVPDQRLDALLVRRAWSVLWRVCEPREWCVCVCVCVCVNPAGM